MEKRESEGDGVRCRLDMVVYDRFFSPSYFILFYFTGCFVYDLINLSHGDGKELDALWSWPGRVYFLNCV